MIIYLVNMRGLLIIALCAVYSVQAWNENLRNLHIETKTGNLPQAYYPLTADDKHATRKAGALFRFVKNVPQVNPFKMATMGPYHVALPDLNFWTDLVLSNVVVQGFKNGTLSLLELRMDPGRVDFNYTAPQISADFNFEAQGNLNGQPININGQVSATLINLSVLVRVGPKVAQIEPEAVYQVDSGDIVIDLDEIQVQMSMSEFSEDFRSIAVQFLKHSELYRNVVDDILRSILKGINQELKRLTAKEILQYLLGSARPSLNIG